ncbi:uncharacterized protein LOC107788592 isoform X2 [Nicotiana tabacum]|uniref:Uncharacterized protein LOC107788592 isoform X2 n=2 Tax=Nicotiana TaxID=4085 RepID=A0A1S3ZN09_TOBAC|nr:PREDICTED: uncharacterized protein LOC104235457 isoform X2 [Nicotiana sylvestris]XP_016465761.1 PREDICTED: uncharacterized protein LOC107788592 isoform X2 [Nicotiana tabacum]
MEMEVMITSPPVDFNFDSTCTTPYISASSSPQRFGNYFLSAPTSPARVSALYDGYNHLHGGDALRTTGGEVPFNWEEKPGIPKSRATRDDDDENDDFAFDFSGQLERSSVSAADELFDGGKIKPLKLKPPPRLQYEGKPFDSPKSPKKKFKQAFSPRNKKKELDPFAAALEQSSRTENDRPGRERTQKSTTSSRHKKTRSLSPFRASDLLFDSESKQENTNISDSSSSFSSMITLWYRKWKLKDLFLFRSASEGRATNKDQLNRFLKKTHSKEDAKTSSFRSTGSSVGSSSVSSSLRKREVSAHELHYTLNRALSEEMKRKTFLPYKNGVLGCLGFVPSLDDTSFRGVNRR